MPALALRRPRSRTRRGRRRDDHPPPPSRAARAPAPPPKRAPARHAHTAVVPEDAPPPLERADDRRHVVARDDEPAVPQVPPPRQPDRAGRREQRLRRRRGARDGAPGARGRGAGDAATQARSAARAPAPPVRLDTRCQVRAPPQITSPSLRILFREPSPGRAPSASADSYAVAQQRDAPQDPVVRFLLGGQVDHEDDVLVRPPDVLVDRTTKTAEGPQIARLLRCFRDGRDKKDGHLAEQNFGFCLGDARAPDLSQMAPSNDNPPIYTPSGGGARTCSALSYSVTSESTRTPSKAQPSLRCLRVTSCWTAVRKPAAFDQPGNQ